MTDVQPGGALLGRGEFDWQAGSNSPIDRVILRPDSNWKEISIPHELQFLFPGEMKAYDTQMCVSFNGSTDAIEYIMMQQLKMGLIPNWKVKWLQENGYFENGFLNFNERFTGTIGKTTIHGAYLFTVANGMRNYGLIPGKMLPYADNFFDNIDMKFITPEMLVLGKRFAELFRINFEWVNSEDTRKFMQYSPLACTGHYGTMIGDIPLDPQSNVYHSMLQIAETNEYREIDDSYWQQFKKYKKHALRNFMAFYVDASDNSMFNSDEFIKAHDQYIIRNSNTGAYGAIYQGTPMLVMPERAGLFMIDRDARGLLAKKLFVSLTDQEWKILRVDTKF